MGYRLGVPERCWYEEVFNSDSTFYGGSNLGNGPGLMAERSHGHGRPHSMSHHATAAGRRGASSHTGRTERYSASPSSSPCGCVRPPSSARSSL